MSLLSTEPTLVSRRLAAMSCLLMLPLNIPAGVRHRHVSHPAIYNYQIQQHAKQLILACSHCCHCSLGT